MSGAVGTQSTPRETGFCMPAEWAPHRRCWMAWPCRRDLWGDGIGEAKAAYAGVARAIAAFEPVHMVARPEDADEARSLCGTGTAVLALPLDDSWMRDIGPTFLVHPDGRVAGCDWRFNAWGAKEDGYAADAALAGRVLEHLGMPRFAAPMTAEGGALHVDGEGTVLSTASVLLNPNRNAGMDRQRIDDLLCQFLGAEKVLWLPDGLVDDMTDGHVDNVACFVRPGKVLAMVATAAGHPDRDRLQANLEALAGMRDARGRRLDVATIEAPPALREGDRRLSLSYINFYLANGAVIFPQFGVPQDTPARELVAALFPDRHVVPVAVRAICRGGGGIHCITQQEPAPLASDSPSVAGGGA